MKVVSVGGGPAGLYAAILLAKGRPPAEVTVFERNARDETFGFGVVFSDQTLANLRDADPVSHERITAAFARWDAIDIHYAGQVVRAGGNAFAGIARKRLLGILQRRAEELGVRLEFSRDADPLAAAAEADLVLAADGVGSRTRAQLAGAFRPRLQTHDARYIWLGATLELDAFTFLFRESEHGRFQVHAYPYEAGMSTFIVECDQDAWRRAGLDRASVADSIAYAEELFAAELDGHKLLANQSRWIGFVTVTNRTWHSGNVVLLGDAAHTAHFSIGSGTKLAMEDAIALARNLEQHHELEVALAAYESERRPVVERTQQAAQASRAWFERYHRYLGFAPPQFAVSLLARSGRVSYDNLRLRDPRLVHALDRWFAARASGRDDPGRLEVAPSPAFAPFRLGALDLPNRLVSAPPPDYAAHQGEPGAAWLAELEAAGSGGAGLVLAELVAVAPEARVTSGCAGLFDQRLAERWASLVAAVHRAGPARVGVQLVHAGPRGATRPRTLGTDWPLREGWPLVAASALAYGPRARTPEALDAEGMRRVAGQFARAAELAAGAGFDLLELHFGHGYLPATFLSPLTNRRTDGYGGAIARRLRFPLEVIEAVRQRWPADRPLGVRFSASDRAPGGITPEEAVAAAAAFAEAGCAFADVVAGQTTADGEPEYGPAFYAEEADLIRNQAGVPTITSGSIPTPADADTLLAAGRADLCILGRPRLPDPDWLGR